MKNFAPMLALLAFLPIASPAHANTAPKTPEPITQEAVARIKSRVPNKPTIYVSANGICELHPKITREITAEGDTLVMTYTVHAKICAPTEKTHFESHSETIDLLKEAKAAGITAAKPQLKAVAKLAHD